MSPISDFLTDRGGQRGSPRQPPLLHHRQRLSRVNTTVHLQLLIVPLIAILMRVGSTSTADASYLIVAIYALRGRFEVIQALTLSWLFTSLNPNIADQASLTTIGRYLILATCGASIILNPRSSAESQNEKHLLGITFLLGAFLILHSAFFSYLPQVSILKSLAWLLAMSTTLICWSSLSRPKNTILANQIFRLLCLILFTSVIYRFIDPNGSFLPRSTLFRGIMSHSQAFGITMAILGTWAALRVLSSRRSSWFNVFIALSAGVALFSSGTRTALLAMILGILVSALLLAPSRNFVLHKIFPGIQNPTVAILIFLSPIGLAIAGPGIAKEVDAFIDKGTLSDISILQTYQISRGGLIDAMMKNIRQKPLEGIGFGMASIPEMIEVTRDPYFNLPIGAAVEKGVLPLAVMEETGLFGFIFFVYWIWLMLALCLKMGSTPMALFSVVILLNFGEAILFSAGGMGLLTIVILGLSLTHNRPTIKSKA
jgi:hypothetical protein